MLVELIWLLGVFPQLKNWHAYSFSHQFNQIRKNFIALSDRFKVAHIKIPANYTQCLRTFGSSGSTVQIAFLLLTFLKSGSLIIWYQKTFLNFETKKPETNNLLKKKRFPTLQQFLCVVPNELSEPLSPCPNSMFALAQRINANDNLLHGNPVESWPFDPYPAIFSSG